MGLFALKRKCDPVKWNVGAGRVDGKTEFAKSLNSYLDVLQRKVYEAWKSLVENEHPVTSENIKTLSLGKEITVHKYMLMEVFKHHNDQMAALVGIEYAPGTLERYTTSYNHTRPFLEVYLNLKMSVFIRPAFKKPYTVFTYMLCSLKVNVLNLMNKTG